MPSLGSISGADRRIYPSVHDVRPSRRDPPCTTTARPPPPRTQQPAPAEAVAGCPLYRAVAGYSLFPIPYSLSPAPPAPHRRAVTSSPRRTTPTVTGLFTTSPFSSNAMAPDTPACAAGPPSRPMRAT